ncbi:GntG family PLP-dependent aldolase [Balneolales bacterium ANBcel1]|nr:GntG family PLP-dependent aldolase [Balneolales bacterium ANBcel1]
MIDLRSDTVTRPTEPMWDVMNRAPVGDDVFGEDPGINALEVKVAGLFGKEEGLFVPSGTMGNQLGVKVHTQSADEVIIDEHAHIFNSEGAAAGLISGVQMRTLPGNRGVMDPERVADAIRSKNDWDPHTRLVAVENTSNMGGGTCYPLQTLRDIYETTRRHSLALHMDGARIWNAAVATGTRLEEFGALCDTISVCFSKGLGAPVGSMLLGSGDEIKKARRYRKLLGGGMRQAGMLAAAASYAVDHHFNDLAHDHRRAKTLAHALSASPYFQILPEHVETNIVLFKVDKAPVDAVLDHFHQHGVAMIPFGKQTIRATFHHQVSDADLETVIDSVTSYRL